MINASRGIITHTLIVLIVLHYVQTAVEDKCVLIYV